MLETTGDVSTDKLFMNENDRAAKVNFLMAFLQESGDARLEELISVRNAARDGMDESGGMGDAYEGHRAVVRLLAEKYPDLLALLPTAKNLLKDNGGRPVATNFEA